MFYVYIIKSLTNNWYYVGSAANVEKRLEEHNSGKVFSTKARKPYKIIYTEEFQTALEAREREKAIKAKRIEKESIIIKYGPIV